MPRARTKDRQRRVLERQVREFLKRGGKITQVPFGFSAEQIEVPKRMRRGSDASQP
jgi:hypothetical protein